MIQIDIPMPKHCGECRLMVNGVCYALQADSHTNRFPADLSKRPEWCPLKDRETGSWKNSRIVYWQCTACGALTSEALAPAIYRFCPYCGTKMLKEEP